MATLDASGLTIRTQAEIFDEIAAEAKATIDPELDVSAESVAGQILTICSAKIRESEEGLLAVYSARSPRDATLAGLDALCALTGTRRRAATKGRVTLTVTLAGSTTLTAGAIASVAGQPQNRWVTLTDVANPGGSPGGFDVVAEAENTGAIVANAATITTIATPSAGWTAVTNTLDATSGRNLETDPELRIRREQELSRPGTAPADAIRADVLDVDDVTYCRVYENTSDTTDGDGIPPHSIEVLVLGGAQDEIALQIWRSKAAGIGTYGTTTETVEDSLGNPRTVKFTRPSTLSLYVAVTVDAGDGYAGDAAVKAAIVAAGIERYTVGDDVKASHFYEAVLAVVGVEDCSVLVGTSGPGAATSVSVGPRQVASFDTTRVTVTS